MPNLTVPAAAPGLPIVTQRGVAPLSVDRAKIARAIDRLLALLDQIDGDPDSEPSLGSLVDVFGGPYGCTTLPQTEWGASGSSDREMDAGDECEAEDQEGDGEFSGGDILGADEPAFEHPWGLAA